MISNNMFDTGLLSDSNCESRIKTTDFSKCLVGEMCPVVATDQFIRNYEHCSAARHVVVDLLESSMLLSQLHFKLNTCAHLLHMNINTSNLLVLYKWSLNRRIEQAELQNAAQAKFCCFYHAQNYPRCQMIPQHAFSQLQSDNQITTLNVQFQAREEESCQFNMSSLSQMQQLLWKRTC